MSEASRAIYVFGKTIDLDGVGRGVVALDAGLGGRPILRSCGHWKFPSALGRGDIDRLGSRKR